VLFLGMVKGKETKTSIIEVGLDMASRVGLESVTIGNLAKEMGMSKSGLFAHFQSKENLQIAILDYAAEDFSQDVISPALKTERGIPRIRKLVDNWITWSYKYPGGCIFVSAGTEYSDRPGRVRDCLMRQQETAFIRLLDSYRPQKKTGLKKKPADGISPLKRK
jgi:AcrR family transcriptional regulator